MPRVRDHNSISLFPFLAVLVCAMGALILLLLVTTRRIRTEALERAYEAAQAVEPVEDPVEPTPASEPDVPPLVEVEPPAPPPADVEEFQPRAIALGPAVEAPRPPPRPIDPNPELQERIAALVSHRDLAQRKLQALEAELHAARDRGAELQARLDRTREQQEETRSAREQARRRIGDLEAEQQRLRAQIHEAERRIAAAERQPAAASQFVVVPYDGVSGTNRRPILIEFTGDGIRFIPENIVLRKDDFEGFTPGYNPLLAGARALMDYWTERSRRSGGQEPLPYVLLIVRPSGVEYYPLRLLLERLEQPFGYELLEESQQLALPEADPVAAELCRIAVERMLVQRNALLQIVRGDGGAGAGGGQASGAREGFTQPAEGNASGTLAGDGFASSRNGGASEVDGGERRGPVFRGYQRPSYDLVEPDSGIVLPSQRRRPTLVHVPGGRRGGGPGAMVSDATGRRTPADGTGATSAASSGAIAGGAASPGNLTAATEDRRAPAASGVPTGSDQAARSSSPASVTSGNVASGWAPFRTASRSEGDFGRADDTAGTGGGGFEPNPLLSGRPSNSSPSSDASMLADAEPSDPFEAALRGETGGAAGAWGSLSDVAGDSLSATSAGQGQSSMTSATTSGATGSSAAGAAAAGQAGSGAGSSSMMPPAGAEELPVPTMTLPTITLRNSELADLPPHRRRWGLSSPRATIGYERELQIEVGADRLIVGGEHVVRAGNGETREELAGRMVTAIEAAARGWGSPPDAFYWVPALRFTVAPGGNRHYERLRGPLREWGLQSAATYTLDPPRTAARSTP